MLVVLPYIVTNTVFKVALICSFIIIVIETLISEKFLTFLVHGACIFVLRMKLANIFCTYIYCTST